MPPLFQRSDVEEMTIPRPTISVPENRMNCERLQGEIGRPDIGYKDKKSFLTSLSKLMRKYKITSVDVTWNIGPWELKK